MIMKYLNPILIASCVAMNAAVLFMVIQHQHGPFSVQCRQTSFQIPLVMTCQYPTANDY